MASVAAPPVELRLVDVDADQRRRQHEAAVGIHVVVGRAELGADGEHDVGFGHQRADGAQARAGVDTQRMGVEQAAAVRRGDHRRVEAFGQRPQRGVGMAGAAAGEDQRPPRARKHRRGLFQRACLGDGCWAGRCDGPQFGRRQGHDVERDLDMHWPRSSRCQQREGPLHGRLQLGRILDAFRRQRHRRHQAALVGQFVQEAQPLAQRRPLVDAGDDQNRRGIGARLGHGGDGIGQARSGDDEGDAGPAAGARVTVGHEGGALLVARRHVADRRRGEAAVELDRVHARDAEDGVDAMGFEQGDQRFADGGHGLVRIWRVGSEAVRRAGSAASGRSGRPRRRCTAHRPRRSPPCSPPPASPRPSSGNRRRRSPRRAPSAERSG